MALAEHELFEWDEESFVRAWELGIFGEAHYEMVDGKAVRVVIGAWHGQVTMNLGHLLRQDGWTIASATLPAAGSVPDPDAFVFRRGASPVDYLGANRTVPRWDPADVGLVVEVSESSWALDTGVKAERYGQAGYPSYWVVHRGGVEVFTEPYEGGYGRRIHVAVDGTLELPYSPGETISVAELLDVVDV